MLQPVAGTAEGRLPGNDAPVPTFRPNALVSPDAAEPAEPPFDALIATERNIGPLKEGLDALAKGDIASARRARDAMSAGSIDRRILAWAIALSGAKAVTSTEIKAAMDEIGEWPGSDAMHRNVERALHDEVVAPETVVDMLQGAQPAAREGVVALARAHLALGDREAAMAVLAPFWRSARLEAKEEAAILREFGDLISADVHRARMEQMLHFDRVNSALRVAERAGAKELAEAWGAVIRRERQAAKLLDAVPQEQRGAAYIFARARHLRWAGKYREAAQVMLHAPSAATALVDPDAWWVERRVLSRELLDIDDAETAYKLAAAHAAESPAMAADAEFHAGWFALRGLQDPALAANHFDKIISVAEGPISLSRAWYWLGRTAEAGGPGDAGEFYARAARYSTAFYGQLAAARIGKTSVSVDYPAPSDADRRTFEQRQAVRAIRRLEAAGHAGRADMLYRSLAADLASAGELALLAVMAEKRGDHPLALRVGKIAAGRGIDIGALAHPVGAIPPSADVSGPAGRALAYAVARQESEFNVAAVSPSGARGLLQLLPGTARDMARRAGLNYSRRRLTTDPAYNTTLGAAFLNEQLDRFGGSYVLTFAGYNAGPARAQEWVTRYGDPRGADIDTVVDWIERIPFTETRNYVQRVMENYQVYKMRLSGRIEIEDDLVK
ncbi:MAG: lytic transglycosylase domain-containing protein [Rhizobiaceae bacterium]|nr:lytic transglycosylase domain-containing protein [Rhizobiaceae bacterium]